MKLLLDENLLRRIVTTQDADFYEMSLIHGQPPKIVWLKMGNQSYYLSGE